MIQFYINGHDIKQQSNTLLTYPITEYTVYHFMSETFYYIFLLNNY